MIYKIIRYIFFLFPPESTHYFTMNVLKFLCKITPIKSFLYYIYKPKDKVTNIFNLEFKNPIGLAAGFDKNATYLNELDTLGFGFIEIGTVTPKSQSGNDKPRLFRLPKDKALINRMGFNNDGIDIIVKRLKKFKLKNNTLIIGGNIGKNKSTPNEDAYKDYNECFEKLFNYVDYFVVNVSSPNTIGLRELQEKESLRKILTNLQNINNSKPVSKPILLKIAPDLTYEQIDDIIDLSIEIKLDGLVVSNTTIGRDNLKTSKIDKIGIGGLSGKPITNKSTEIIEYINRISSSQINIIGSGGVFTKSDMENKFKAGSKLVQVWTGFIYEGPCIVKKLLK